MIPLMLGLGGLIAKVAAAAVIPRVIKALSAMGGSTETFRANPSKPVPETVSAPVQSSEKVLYGRSPLTAHSYRYSTYGERTKEAGDLDSDFGFAGLFHHGPSGLDLATYRTYDSAQGRWISRDPLGEGAGINLYAYCDNNPISGVDPMGTYKVDGVEPPGFAAAHALALKKLKSLRDNNCTSADEKLVLGGIITQLEDPDLTYRFTTGGPQTPQAARRGDYWGQTYPADIRRRYGNPDTVFFPMIGSLSTSDLSNLIIHEGGHAAQGGFPADMLSAQLAQLHSGQANPSTNPNSISEQQATIHEMREHPASVFPLLNQYFPTDF